MTRVGWVFLGVVALVLAAFVGTTRFGGSPVAPVAPRGEKIVDHVETAVRSTVARATGSPSTTVDGGSLPTLIVPVEGVARAAVSDTWGQARSEGRVHHGTDIIAPAGTRVLAAADGVIEKLFQSRLGGTTLYERSPDRRWTYYYAHLTGYAPGLHEGQQVRAGDLIAYVGDTGDAGPGNFHLHFGLTRTTPDQHWYQGDDVNAYPALAGMPPRR